MALDALGSRTEGVPGIAFDTGESDEEASGQDGAAAVVVRSDFRSTIFWKPDVVTDKNGKATVTVQYADSLTR